MPEIIQSGISGDQDHEDNQERTSKPVGNKAFSGFRFAGKFAVDGINPRFCGVDDGFCANAHQIGYGGKESG